MNSLVNPYKGKELVRIGGGGLVEMVGRRPEDKPLYDAGIGIDTGKSATKMPHISLDIHAVMNYTEQ